uniref:Mitochondrial ribosomal protein S18C n=1 Tax=Vombatus ursinus TaxID=29139 RepID=A0A4X2LK52_VOMUR
MVGALSSLALEREKLIMHLGSTCIGCASCRVQTALWSSCSQYKQLATNEDLPLLFQFVSPFTRNIYGRHVTGLCGKKQKEITKAIKQAQIMGLMSVTYKDPACLKHPKIHNIKY